MPDSPASITFRARLFLSFAGLFLIALVAVELGTLFGLPGLDTPGLYQRTLANELAHLNAAADLKRTLVDSWVHERILRVQSTARSSAVQRFATTYAARPPDSPAEWAHLAGTPAFTALDDFLADLRNTYRFIDLELIDLNGMRRVLAIGEDAPPNSPGTPIASPATLRGAPGAGTLFVGTIHLAPNNRHGLEIGQVLDDGRLLLIARTELTTDLGYLLGQGDPLLTASSETLLVDDAFHPLTPAPGLAPELPPTAPLPRHRPNQVEALAAAGGEGALATTDYRDREVLAAFRHIRVTPDVGWGLVVKRDRAEVVAQVFDRLGHLLAADLVLILAVLLVAGLLAGRLTRPLTELAAAAARIEAGDLSARAPPPLHADELGALAGTFNRMADEVQRWQADLEQVLAQRTQDLRASEERYRQLFFGNKVAQLLIDRNEGGRIVEANQAALDYYGYDAETFKSMRITDLNVLAPEVIAGKLGRAEQGRDNHFYCRHRLASGEVRDVEVHSGPIQLGGRTLLYSNVHDITRRREAERRLHESEARLREAGRLASLGHWEWDLATSTVACSAQVARQLGYAEEDRRLALSDYLDHLHPEDRDATWAAMQAAVRRQPASDERGPYRCEFRVRDAQGGVRHISTIGEVRLDDSGAPVALVGTSQDVTDRKLAELEMAQARQAAEAANRAKSAFIANMSHELRTPLNAVLGFAQILERDPTLSPGHLNSIASIHSGGEYLLTLINDILDLAKIEAGRFELFPNPWDTREFFDGISDLFRSRAEQKGILFTRQAPTPLPPLLHCDEKRLRQVVLNLLGNAVKFTDQGRVTLRTGFADGRLVIEVEDTGVGIPVEHQEAVFEPFTQVGEAAHKQQGTGLGLTITRRLIQAMGGNLILLSAPGQGTLFRVEVPADAITAEQAPPPHRHHPRITGYRRTSGEGPLRILIVDDLPEGRRILHALLAPLGFEVEEAQDGDSCLAAAQRRAPDLILMDLRMPGMDGIEATRALRAIPGFETLPIIAVSAGALADDRERAQASGCNAHLAKPVIFDTLLNEISRLLPLEWQAAEAAEPDDAELLSPVDRGRLLTLLRKGAVKEMRAHLQELAEQYPNHPEIGRLLALTQAYRIAELRRVLGETEGTESTR